MFTVKISDGFCEYTYRFESPDGVGHSISDITDAIILNTQLKMIDKKLTKRFNLNKFEIEDVT